MADVFISYARANQAFAQRIAEAVRREGYKVWWDDDLPPHLSYGDVITEKIGGCKAAIVVWSQAAAESEWVRAEADLARSERKLIQTSIDSRLPPMPFNQIQFAEIGDWQGEPDHPGWKKVRASLAALCGSPSAAQERTTPSVSASSTAQVSAPPAVVAAGKGGGMAAAVIGGLLLVAAVGGGLFWWRSGPDTDAEGNRMQPAAADGLAAAPGVPQPAGALFTEAAVIEDPDGFTNVRSGPAASSPVVARVNQGEVFTTYPQGADWWQVRTADSRIGYIHRSRIRVLQPDATATATDSGGLAGSDTDSSALASDADAGPAQIFADSSRRRLTEADLAGLSPRQIRIARNEIFARHGRPFRDPGLRQHFERYPWYAPHPGPISLNGIEQANVQLLQQAEQQP